MQEGLLARQRLPKSLKKEVTLLRLKISQPTLIDFLNRNWALLDESFFLLNSDRNLLLSKGFGMV